MAYPAPGSPRLILHVIDSLNPTAGGPTEAIRTLFEFAPQGYAGEVVTLDEPDAPFLSTLPFPVHALGRGSAGVGYSAKLDRWLRENRGRFDGVMVHGLWRYITLATWRAMRGVKPYVVFTHGMLDPYFKKRYPLKHLGKWLYWLASEYWVLRGAHRVLFTTQEESRLAEQSFWLHRWNGMVVALGSTRPPGARPNEADPDHTNPDANPDGAEQDGGERLKAAFYQLYPSLQGRRFLLFLGRIHRKKGCDLLVNSFIKFAAKDPELHLVMAGPDQQGWSSDLQESVAAAGLTHRVHWPGMLNGDVKWGSFFAAEAFVLPSHQENFGIAVAEAMACGRAVLLTDKINIAPEIAQDGAGLIAPDTPAGIDQLLERWIEMPAQQRRSMGRKALATFNARYDMRKNAATIFQMFDQV